MESIISLEPGKSLENETLELKYFRKIFQVDRLHRSQHIHLIIYHREAVKVKMGRMGDKTRLFEPDNSYFVSLDVISIHVLRMHLLSSFHSTFFVNLKKIV